MQINIFCNPIGISGPASFHRNFCESLLKEGAELSIDCQQPEQIELPELYNAAKCQEFENSPAIMLDSIYSWWGRFPMRHNGLVGGIVFEGIPAPYEWILAAAQPTLDHIWVPSNHIKESLLEGVTEYGIKNTVNFEDKIKIVPHGVDPSIFNPEVERGLLETQDEHFTFGYVGGWSQGGKDRKGLDIAYRAFCEEFSDREKVKLVMKITTVYNTPGYDPVKELKKFEPTTAHAPTSLVLSDFKDINQLAKLYRAFDVMVYPSKAEGFGLTAAEAMACGVPVISSSFGGQTDFINKENGWLVKSDGLIPATDKNFFYENTKWALPSKDDFRVKMRYAFDNQGEVRFKGLKAAKQIAENYTWEKTAKLAVKLLKELKD